MSCLTAKHLAVLLAAAIPAIARQPAPSCGEGEGKWRRLALMPQGAVFAAVVLGADGRLYVISGSTSYDVQLTGAVHIYDPKRNVWSEGAPIPTPRTSAGAALGPDGRIYVIGGLDRDRKMNVVEAYDPGRNTWARLSPLPTRREALQAVFAPGPAGRGLIYAIAGRDRAAPGVHLDTVEAYDSATDRWSRCAPMPDRRHAHAAALGPDGRIYVSGGANEKDASIAALDIYDPTTDTWTQGQPAPYGAECEAIACTSGPDGEVLVIGGWDRRKRTIGSVAAYCPHTQNWRRLPSTPAGRAAGGAVVWKDAAGKTHLYLVGGTAEEASGKVLGRKPTEAILEEYVLPKER